MKQKGLRGRTVVWYTKSDRKRKIPSKIGVGTVDMIYSIPLAVIFVLLVAALAAEKSRAKKQQFIVSHDSLTGLYNRESFFSKAEEIIRKNPQKKRYMVCTNIKNFKLANDLFGKEMGDRILADQAKLLTFAQYDDCIH